MESIYQVNLKLLPKQFCVCVCVGGGGGRGGRGLQKAWVLGGFFGRGGGGGGGWGWQGLRIASVFGGIHRKSREG